MEIVGGIDINNHTCWHIGEGTCFNGIFNCSTGLESGVLKGEGACKVFVHYVDTSVHVVFYACSTIHKFGKHGLKLCIILHTIMFWKS